MGELPEQNSNDNHQSTRTKPIKMNQKQKARLKKSQKSGNSKESVNYSNKIIVPKKDKGKNSDKSSIKADSQESMKPLQPKNQAIELSSKKNRRSVTFQEIP